MAHFPPQHFVLHHEVVVARDEVVFGVAVAFDWRTLPAARAVAPGTAGPVLCFESPERVDRGHLFEVGGDVQVLRTDPEVVLFDRYVGVDGFPLQRAAVASLWILVVEVEGALNHSGAFFAAVRRPASPAVPTPRPRGAEELGCLERLREPLLLPVAPSSRKRT